ncbi:MAG: enoyl-CoA hydratase-related protein [Pseudomonadota bacterium]
MSYAAYSTLEFEQQGPCLTIWLNRPEARNSLTQRMGEELCTAMRQAKQDAEVRVVVLRGRGGVFCAGGDLKAFRSMGEMGQDARELAMSFSRDGARFLTEVQQLPQLTIAAVEGAAMAGGFGLACACDVLVTTRDARYSLSEIRVGLVAAQIAPYVIQRIGFARARQLMLLAPMINGEEAFDMGMADRLAQDAGALDDEIARLVQNTLSCSPSAIAASKHILDIGRAGISDTFVQEAARAFADCLVSEEGQEGFQAFMEKRKPAWVP